ncbi:hypothetical protein [Methylobacterium sp. A54F]
MPLLASAAIGSVVSGRLRWWQALLLFWASLGGIELLCLGMLFACARRRSRADPGPQGRD